MNYNPRKGTRERKLLDMKIGGVRRFALAEMDTVKGTITRLHNRSEQKYKTHKGKTKFEVTRIK